MMPERVWVDLDEDGDVYGYVEDLTWGGLPMPDSHLTEYIRADLYQILLKTIMCTANDGSFQNNQAEIDAVRWKFFANSPQTALMLGSNLDPNSEQDWLAECNYLVDSMRKMDNENG